MSINWQHLMQRALTVKYHQPAALRLDIYVAQPLRAALIRSLGRLFNAKSAGGITWLLHGSACQFRSHTGAVYSKMASNPTQRTRWEAVRSMTSGEPERQHTRHVKRSRHRSDIIQPSKLGGQETERICAHHCPHAHRSAHHRQDTWPVMSTMTFNTAAAHAATGTAIHTSMNSVS